MFKLHVYRYGIMPRESWWGIHFRDWSWQIYYKSIKENQCAPATYKKPRSSCLVFRLYTLKDILNDPVVSTLAQQNGPEANTVCVSSSPAHAGSFWGGTLKGLVYPADCENKLFMSLSGCAKHLMICVYSWRLTSHSEFFCHITRRIYWVHVP